jgi:hypothetical protein
MVDGNSSPVWFADFIAQVTSSSVSLGASGDFVFNSGTKLG